MSESLSHVLTAMEPTLLTTGWGRTEGPLWHAGGSVTFVDLAGSRLLRWDPADRAVTVVREQTGEGNGCTLDLQGRLIMCEGADHRRITCMDAAGTVTTLADRWHGKRFNKPNDVVCRSDGSLFFTDPELRLPAAQREIGFSGVFRIDPQGQVHLATDACEYPNGLAFSPDESLLYVAITRLYERCFEEEARGAVCTHRRIRAFDVAPSGSLPHHRVVCDMSSAASGVPDGPEVGTAGRASSASARGICGLAPSGHVTGII